MGRNRATARALPTRSRRRRPKKGFRARVKAMDEYRAADLKGEKNLLLIVSTHGEGEPPDSAKELFEFVHGRKAARLDDTRYSVLALGDTSYEHFCKTGRDFDARLQALGAQPVHPRAECDVDYDDTAAQWIEHALNALATHAKPRAGTAVPLAASSMRKSPRSTRGRIRSSRRADEHQSQRPRLRPRKCGISSCRSKDPRIGYEPGDSVGGHSHERARSRCRHSRCARARCRGEGRRRRRRSDARGTR